MARLHSKKKGKSGTKRPKSKSAPDWSEANASAVKESILKMAREGVPPSRIGLILRDQQAIPNVRAVLGMSLKQFLVKEKAASEYPEDLLNLIKKAVRMTSHIKASKKDVHNSVKLTHVESKIQRLVKYYSSKGEIPAGWKYDREKAALLVK
jgi:small subunit ribosomal protein S15